MASGHHHPKLMSPQQWRESPLRLSDRLGGWMSPFNEHRWPGEDAVHASVRCCNSDVTLTWWAWHPGQQGDHGSSVGQDISSVLSYTCNSPLSYNKNCCITCHISCIADRCRPPILHQYTTNPPAWNLTFNRVCKFVGGVVQCILPPLLMNNEINLEKHFMVDSG